MTAYQSDGLICTHSGHLLNLFDPHDKPMPPLEDFAYHLARVHRFNGGADVDVATHSVALCTLVPNALRLRALLHDGSEAILGDVSRPLKYLPAMEPYRALEARWQPAIYTAFGVPATPDPEELDSLDTALILFEAISFGSAGLADFVRTRIRERLTVNQEHAVRAAYRQMRSSTPDYRAAIWQRYVLQHMADPSFCS